MATNNPAGEHSGSRIADAKELPSATSIDAETADFSAANAADDAAFNASNSAADAAEGQGAGLQAGTLGVDASGNVVPATKGVPNVGGASGTGTGTVWGNDANSIFAQGLASFGLGSLAGKLQQWVLQGLDPTAIATNIRATPEYATRFPGMATLNAQGQGITEAQYIAKEDTDRQLMYQYLGSGASAYDNPDTLGKFITGFKSSAELQSDLSAVHDAMNSSASTKAWLKSTYGLSDQQLALHWLDPATSADQITKQLNASQIAGASADSGFGNLSQSQAETLATQGVTQSQAQSVFGKIGGLTQLEQNLPNNESGALTQQQLLDGAFNGGAAGQTVAQLQAQRLAQFQAGGGAAADASGVVGLKQANTQ